MIVDILCNWPTKFLLAARRNNKKSVKFVIDSDVRQESRLSPAIFNVFTNAFIIQIKLRSIGCLISNVFLGCILYADDITLLSPSVVGLQALLDKCSELASTHL